MPICKKCNNQFPNRVTHQGKQYLLKNRSYCLDCSPIGEREGYNLRKQNTRLGHEHKHCPICNRQFKWTKNNVCSSCRTTYTRHKKRQNAIASLGGKCIICHVDDPDLLLFHHKDPSNKKFNLSTQWHSINQEQLYDEINKCELLCHNCHIKLHREEYKQTTQKIEQYYSH